MQDMSRKIRLGCISYAKHREVLDSGITVCIKNNYLINNTHNGLRMWNLELECGTAVEINGDPKEDGKKRLGVPLSNKISKKGIRWRTQIENIRG